jgi:hypothetical protein
MWMEKTRRLIAEWFRCHEGDRGVSVSIRVQLAGLAVGFSRADVRLASPSARFLALGEFDFSRSACMHNFQACCIRGLNMHRDSSFISYSVLRSMHVQRKEEGVLVARYTSST